MQKKRNISASRKKITRHKSTKVSSAPAVREQFRCTPDHQQWFVLSSGKEIKNLKEFAQDLGDMEEFVFQHHVNPSKNDFVNWVKDVFGDLELAERISIIKDRRTMQIVVYDHLLERLW